ncbi:SMC-Scp complex subunit ScpB [Aridibaculum aurantiacum]|uniref:SMC-Scp complex subunit ScpB n=1 Tax=Aridibaculum aurantiacum TaxID=2810307 RepID=UPI001A96E8ED|nr:SMC-Scp complex subunit ScpB [Aridibaculum aurantiacum]
MELSTIIPHIEALVFASDKPLTSLDIVELINNAFGFMEERITLDQVESAIEGIREKYNAEFYPFEVRESGGGWQFLTKREFHKTVGQLNGDKFLKRLSNAALETLAIIAYKQPITKGEVEAIRGVNSDYSIQKLLEKELIIISGRNEDLPGKPLVYATSKSFMDYFGLNSVDDLPKIKEVLADQAVQGTIIMEGMKAGEVAGLETGEGRNLTVTDSGELVEYRINKSAEGEGLAAFNDATGTGEDTATEDQPGAIEAEGSFNTYNDADETSDEQGDEVDAEHMLPGVSDLSDFSDNDDVTEGDGEEDFDTGSEEMSTSEEEAPANNEVDDMPGVGETGTASDDPNQPATDNNEDDPAKED